MMKKQNGIKITYLLKSKSIMFLQVTQTKRNTYFFAVIPKQDNAEIKYVINYLMHWNAYTCTHIKIVCCAYFKCLLFQFRPDQRDLERISFFFCTLKIFVFLNGFKCIPCVAPNISFSWNKVNQNIACINK